MTLNGEFSIDAPRDAVFSALRDARFFASCVEGVTDLVQRSDTAFDATLETRVAYMKFRFKVSVELVRVEAPDVIEARVEGTPLGLVGRLAAVSRTQLEDVAGGGTRVAYEIDTTLTGKLGAIGQPVVKSKARDMEKQFVTRLQDAFRQPPR